MRIRVILRIETLIGWRFSVTILRLVGVLGLYLWILIDFFLIG